MYKNNYISFQVQVYVQTNDPGCLPDKLKQTNKQTNKELFVV